MIEPHRHEGVFVARGKEDALVTKNLVPGSEVYGEKRISVDVSVDRFEKKLCFVMISAGVPNRQICGRQLVCQYFQLTA